MTTTRRALLKRAALGAAPALAQRPERRPNILFALADDVIALEVDAGFTAVGRYYQEFAQVSDGEVVALLKAAAGR